MVKAGDTLGRIAANHGIGLQELTQLNQLKSTHLRIGQVLRIPGDSPAVSNLALNVGANTTARGNSRYSVKPGDSLWSIARSHNLKVEQLLACNGLKQGDVIAPGQQLTIRPETQGTATPNTQVSYEVKRGDSLYDIARRFRVEVKDILAWNDMELRQLIQPGQSLTLYPGQ